MPKPATLLQGQRFSRLEIVREAAGGRNPCGNTYRTWLCKCDCGATCEVRTNALRSGKTKSCGCLQKMRASVSNTTHGATVGGSGTKTYIAWQTMHRRCYNPNTLDFKNYGERGISVAEDWHKFENFLRDMGNVPAGKTLERLDNSKNYSKDNCKWASRTEQNQNKRNNVYVVLRGERVCLTEACRRLGLSHAAIRKHADRNGCTEQAATDFYAKRR